MKSIFFLIFLTYTISSCSVLQKDKTIPFEPEDVFLTIEVSDKEVIVGQQLNVQVKIYSLRKVWSAGIEKQLEIEGLDIQNKRTKLSLHEVEKFGRIYQTTIIDEFAIYPFVTGSYSIPKLKYRVSFSNLAIGEKPDILPISSKNEINFKATSLPPKYNSNYKGLDIEKMIVSKNDINQSQFKFKAIIESNAHPFFMFPPDLGLNEVAEIELINSEIKSFYKTDKQKHQRIFNYKISFFEKGDFEIIPNLICWDTQTNKAKSVFAGSPIQFKIENIEFEKNDGSIKNNEEVSSEDLIILFDISSSMLAKDFNPTRFDFCKKKLKNLISQKNGNQRIGIIGFAGESYIFQELTTTKKDLIKGLDNIQVGKLTDGTGIGNALMLAVEQLSHGKANSKSIILLTDGNNNSGIFNPLLPSLIIANSNINFLIIGMESEGPVQTPIRRKRDGTYVYGKTNQKFDHDEMRKLILGKGFFIHVKTQEDFDVALNKALNYSETNSPKQKLIISKKLENIYLENCRIFQKNIKLIKD